MPEELILSTLERLRSKKNVILQGPPGVGKTFVARRLALALIGEKREQAVEQLQFHQSYGYEHFVRGFRPTESGFTLKDGPFLRFCELALQDPDLPHVLIIDEINRGNLSKTFGELLTLIEADKRRPEHGIRLAYAEDDEERFHIPPNVHIIGTMNTADRSLAVVDYALRRRFAFISIDPAFGEPSFDQHLDAIGVPSALKTHILDRFRRLNRKITDDRQSLGPGYRIGHSYFCKAPTEGSADEEWYERILATEIRPLLEEYWFDRPSRAEDEYNHLRVLS